MFFILGFILGIVDGMELLPNIIHRASIRKKSMIE